MKRLLCGCVTLLAVTTSSWAQVPLNWSGFYFGAHIGNGWGRDNFDPGVDPQQFRASGLLGGAQFGFNRTLGNSRWVWGAEIDFSFTDVQQGVAAPFSTGASVKSFGTDRLRFGYSIGHSLFYFTGGLAWADVEFSNFFRHGRNVQVGWTAGVGVEHALNDRWSVKVEYLFADLDTTQHVSAPGNPIRYNALSMDVVRLGINYRPVPYQRLTDRVASRQSNWSGAYIGLHGTYVEGSTFYDDPFSGLPQRGNFNGGLFGLQSGYNWLFSSSGLFGIESDFSFGKAKGANVLDDGGTLYDVTASINKMGSTRLRLGMVSDRMLFYSTVGVAYAQFLYDFRQQGSPITYASHDTFIFGWTAGMGLEYLLSSDWSLKLEYRHFDFSNDQQTSGTATAELSGKINSVLVGFNYRGALIENILSR